MMEDHNNHLRPRQRSRANSSASNASRYVPDGYPSPAATIPQGFQPQPYRQNAMTQPIPYIDPSQPVPDSVRYGVRRPSHPESQSPQSPSFRHSYREESYLTPHTRDPRPQYARDPSQSSVHSRRSIASTHSHHSHHSHRSHRSSSRYRDEDDNDDERREKYARRERSHSRARVMRDDGDDYLDRRERRSEHRNSNVEPRTLPRHDSLPLPPIRRAETHYPTIGGTVMSLWETFRDALGPRSKH